MVVEFPMVEEGAAVGRVAAVYADASDRMPFVPSLLKSLAVCPPYLVLAWQQVGAVLEESALADAASRLAADVELAATPPPDPGDRALLVGFVDPIAKMLLLSCGLLAALDGDLRGRPSAIGEIASPPDGPLSSSLPGTRDLNGHAAELGRIRATLDTPIINTIWRTAAAEGRLERLWAKLEPQATATRAAADRVQQAAIAGALRLPWHAVADRAALARSGISDAQPGMRVILDAYATTLPRVLALVASSAAD